MELKEYFTHARRQIVVFGTNSLIPHLEQGAELIANLLTLNRDLRITILYESDSEEFGQSLCVDTKWSKNRISFSSLCVHRDRICGGSSKAGLYGEILDRMFDADDRAEVANRIQVRQINLRIPVNLIVADDNIWCAIVTNTIPTIDSYFAVEKGTPLALSLSEMVESYIDPERAGIFLSKPGQELIELYDKQGYPRGIFPRDCFYTTDFQRYSVWGLIFNRKSELLLHKRSLQTKDGRGLWDKSIGGHVDLRDASTHLTVQRELVEELFLPEAEYTKYIRADLGDIINFGDWVPKKRLERSFKDAFSGLEPADWIMFRATNDLGDPLTITRTSMRRIHDGDKITIKPTVFMSDVYLFIAPPDYLDTTEQMNRLLEVAERSGAASAHKLVTIQDLRGWVQSVEASGSPSETFTDDLIHINQEYRGMLERFTEFISYVV